MSSATAVSARLRSAPRAPTSVCSAIPIESPSLPAWDSYADYLDAVDAQPPSLNVAALVGHGTIRFDAMGNARRAPTPSELARMSGTAR